ncbi:MAG: hypothetical protein ACKPKO_63145, partial [Candidatus Fonsibacter sp.]
DDLRRVGSMVVDAEDGPPMLPSASHGSAEFPPGPANHEEMHKWCSHYMDRMLGKSPAQTV